MPGKARAGGDLVYLEGNMGCFVFRFELFRGFVFVWGEEEVGSWLRCPVCDGAVLLSML